MTKPEIHYLEQEFRELLRTDPTMFDFLERATLDGLWYWDLENPEIEWLNQGFWETLGFDPATKQHRASEWQDLIHPDDLRTALRNFAKHCEDPNHPYDQVVRYLDKDGSTVWVRCRGLAVRNPQGEPVRMLGAHNNITELMRTQDDLRRAQKELEDRIADRTRALKTNEARFREFTDIASDWFWEADRDFRFTFISSRFSSTTGHDPDHYIGKTRRDFATDLGEEEKWSRHQADLESHRSFRDFQYQLNKPGGEVIWVATGGNPVFDDDGKFSGYRGVGRDITTRKKAENELSGTLSQLKFALAANKAGTYTLDLETSETIWSDENYRLLGYEPGEVGTSLKSWLDRVAADDRRLAMETIAEAKATGSSFELEFRAIMPDGTEKWIRDSGSVLKDERGHPKSITGIQIDITERKRTELALARSESTIHAIVEYSPVPMVLKDLDRGILTANEAFADLVEIPLDELLGTDPRNTEQSAYALAIKKHEDYVLATGQSTQEERRRIRHDGSVIEHLVTKFPVPGPYGEIFGVGTIMTDISQRRRMEDALREEKENAEAANKAKSTFLARMSHDFRTPLNAIIGFSEMMKTEVFGALGHPKYRAYVNDIVESGEFLLGLINNLLDTAKIEAGYLDLHPIDCKLQRAIARSCTSVFSSTNKKISLKENLPIDFLVFCDEQALYQILNNILSNSVKSIEYFGVIDISLIDRQDDYDDYIEFQIADNGVGMTDQELRQATEPFVTGARNVSSMHPAEGSGLGLSIVKALIEAHGGILSIESEYKNGTTVKVALPTREKSPLVDSHPGSSMSFG